MFTVFATAWCVCEDLDTHSCLNLLAQDPKLCMGGVFAMTACAKTCGMCPLTCYHCDQPVPSAELCNTTKVCNLKENCMMTTVSSTHDGHTEYRMGCASDDVCDGTAVFVGRRDISTHCCTNDLCNSPPAQVVTTIVLTTTAQTSTAAPITDATATATGGQVCDRDIVFMIEDSSNASYEPYIRQFLSSFTSSLTIGPDDSLVNLWLFDSGTHEQIDLNSEQNDTWLANEIQSLSFNHNSDRVDVADVLKHIENVITNTHHGGDRQEFPDVIIILSDHESFYNHHGHGAVHIKTDLTAASDIIVINVGPEAVGHSLFTQLATTSAHVLNLQSYAELQSQVAQILQLMCG